jgi:hypothetical protein
VLNAVIGVLIADDAHIGELHLDKRLANPGETATVNAMKAAIDAETWESGSAPRLRSITKLGIKDVSDVLMASCGSSLTWIFRETRACLGADKRKCLSCKA